MQLVTFSSSQSLVRRTMGLSRGPGNGEADSKSGSAEVWTVDVAKLLGGKSGSIGV